MNLGEERSRQKLLEILELLKLSEKNSRLAEHYLDLDQPEEPKRLLEAEPQDFSRLTQEVHDKCREYVSHCLKRNRKEEFVRFVRFSAAVGGSTAYYVLVRYGWNLNTIREYISREQASAIRAEGIVWNSYGIKNVLSNMEQKDPEVLRKAMKLCFHKSGNAKVLLAAVSLYYTKPYKGGERILRRLFPTAGKAGEEPQPAVQKTVDYLEANLTDSITGLFTGAAPQEEELEEMKAFVRTARAEEPFPPKLYAALQGKQTSEYLLTMLSGAAFLALEHSRPCAAFIKLAMVMDHMANRTAVLQMCLSVGGQSWFSSHIRELEKQLPIPGEEYMQWCLKNCKYAGPAKRIIKDHPDIVRNLISSVSSEEYQHLLAMAKDLNPMLYQELNSAGAGQFRAKLADELTSRYTKGKAEAKAYLLGEGELETLYPYVKEWRNIYCYIHQIGSKIYALKKNRQEQQMYRRAVVLEGLCMRAGYFVSHWNGKYQKPDRTLITEVLEVFEQEQLPVEYQLEALGAIHDSFYQEKEKTGFMNDCVMVVRQKEWCGDLIRLSREGTAVVRFLCIRVLDAYGSMYKKALLGCAADSSKMVRELLVAVYESRPEWEEEVKHMLTSRKSQEREMAVQVLKRWGAENCQETLKEAFSREKSKKIKELLADCLGMETSADGEKKERTLEELAKEILKGGRKRKISWVFEEKTEKERLSLPVHKKDGSFAGEDYLAAILVCYADMGRLGVNPDAGRLAEDLVSEELARYMETLFESWLEQGAEAKKKWVLYAASIHGKERIIPLLYARIQEWPKASRGAMAAEAVKALALNGSPTALLLVDQISRKFKFRQVKAAASEALSYAAEQLGITKAELEDRIIPDLGFDAAMEQTFDYGSRIFKVFLTSALELEVYDEKGKKLKNLPAPGKKDEPEKAKAANDAYKQLKKQLKTVAANQRLRLEQALSTERLWETARWQELFVNNPVMHQFAIGLIWGLYEGGTLKESFRYMEDGSFNTADEEEYELPKDGRIGLVHPVELEEESLSVWKEQLSDYEVVQPLEQLERPVYRLTGEEKEQTELTRFGGRLLNCLSLSGKLQSLGWYRGSVQDAGGYYTFYREDGEIGVELEFSGAFVGGENEEVTVYGAQFYRAGTVQRGSYVYDTIRKENRYCLGEVSPRYFSEIVLQLTKATASFEEQLPYPECKERK